MKFTSLDHFLRDGRAILAKGPIALVMAEDQVEVETTLLHHLELGFLHVILLANDGITIPDQLAERVHRVAFDTHVDSAMITAVNRIIKAAPGIWIYYCYNTEYLFYPFSETRSIREMLAFQSEERRDAILSYVVDLYAEDLDRFPNAVSLETAQLDRSGYYALGRPDAANHNHPRERQLDFFRRSPLAV